MEVALPEPAEVEWEESPLEADLDGDGKPDLVVVKELPAMLRGRAPGEVQEERQRTAPVPRRASSPRRSRS